MSHKYDVAISTLSQHPYRYPYNTSSSSSSSSLSSSLGDVHEMSRELMSMQEEIEHLEAEQNRHISTVQSGRLLCAQLSTDTSSLRLAMFTRRMRHRNTLHAHVMTTNAHTQLNTGTQPAAPAPAVPRSVPMLSRTHSRNSNNGHGNGSSSAAQADVDLLTQARALLGDGGNNGTGAGVSVHTRGSANNSSASASASVSVSAASAGGGGVSGGGGSRSSSRLGQNNAVTGNKLLVDYLPVFQCILSTPYTLNTPNQHPLLTYPFTTVTLPYDRIDASSAIIISSIIISPILVISHNNNRVVSETRSGTNPCLCCELSPSNLCRYHINGRRRPPIG